MKTIHYTLRNHMNTKANAAKGKTVYSEVKVEVVANGYLVKASGGHWVAASAKKSKPVTEPVFYYPLGGLITSSTVHPGDTRLVFANFAALTKWLRANTKALVATA